MVVTLMEKEGKENRCGFCRGRGKNYDGSACQGCGGAGVISEPSFGPAVPSKSDGRTDLYILRRG